MNVATITLPPVLDFKAACSLKADIQAHAGAPLDLDVSKVERVGGLCLQVVLAAAEAWKVAGLPFQLVHANDTVRNDVRLMGATHLLSGVEAC